MSTAITSDFYQNTENSHNNWLFAILAFLLAFAPIFRGSNRPLPLLIVQIATLGLVSVLLWHPGRLRELPLSIRLISLLSLLGIGVSLIPIPESLWLSISGHDLYADAIQLVSKGEDVQRSLSILPNCTDTAWFKMLTLISVFSAAYLLPALLLQRLVYLIIGIAAFESILGLMQWGSGIGGVLRFGETLYGRDAIGTYANRDHLAGFLSMVIPVLLGLLAAELGHYHVISGNSRRRRARRGEFLTTISGKRTIFMALMAILLLLGLVFTRSRAGIALAMLGLILAMFAFAWRLGGSNVYGSVGSIIAVLVILTAEIGLLPVLDRFSEDPMQDARWTIYASTLDAIGHFFPFGSGAGTFPFVYPIFQPIELGDKFINNVHNDYLESIFEEGMLAVVLIAWGVMLYAIRWGSVWVKIEKWGKFRFVQVGSGIGILMLMLHSFGDFNLQIPANAIFFTFFAGVFFKNYEELEIPSSRRRRNRGSHTRTEPPSADANTSVAVSNKESKQEPAGMFRTWEDFGDVENPFKEPSPTPPAEQPTTNVKDS